MTVALSSLAVPPLWKTAILQMRMGIVSNEDYVLPIPAVFDKLAAHMDVWNPEQEIEMGLFRMPAPELNKRAIREAIVNAFSHRDNSKMGRVRIEVTDEGLTIAIPGGWIEGVTIDSLLSAEPHGRNPLLSDALRRTGLAEKTGRGIDRIFEGSLIYGRALPDYTLSTSAFVSLFIPRSRPDVQIAKLVADEQKRPVRPLPLNTLLLLNALRDMPRSDVRQLSEALHLSETMIRTVLDTKPLSRDLQRPMVQEEAGSTCCPIPSMATEQGQQDTEDREILTNHDLKS